MRAADPRPARVRVARRARGRQAAVQSATWVAAMTVVDGPRRRGPGPHPPARARPGSSTRCAAEVTRRGEVRPCLRIVRGLFAALTDPAGVIAHRPGGVRTDRVDADGLGRTPGPSWPTPRRGWSPSWTSCELTELVTSIDGLSPVGAAAILAETGDLHRFTSARAVVKHAGLAPRERMSGTFTGRARLTGAGRPQLRVAAWRAVWGCLQTNRVYAARYRHLTTRETQQAQADPGPDRRRRARSCASCTPSSSTSGRGTRPSPPTAPVQEPRQLRHNRFAPDAPPRGATRPPELGRGEPSAALRTPAVSRRSSQAAPSRRRHNPITRCRAPARLPLCRDRRRDTGTRPPLDAKHL